MPKTANGNEPTLLALPTELLLAVLEQTGLNDLCALRRVCTRFETIVNEHLLYRLRRIISQESQEEHISNAARLLIVLLDTVGELGDNGYQKWCKMAAIYEQYMRTTEFEAKDWKSCVTVLKGRIPPALEKARRELWWTLSELNLPFHRDLIIWANYIAASVVNKVLPDGNVEGLTQDELEEWVKSFTYTVNDRLSEIKTIKSEKTRRIHRQHRDIYKRRRDLSNRSSLANSLH